MKENCGLASRVLETRVPYQSRASKAHFPLADLDIIMPHRSRVFNSWVQKNESRVFYTRFQIENKKRTNPEKEERTQKKKKEPKKKTKIWEEEKNPQKIWRKNEETLGRRSGWRRTLGGAMKKNTSDAGRSGWRRRLGGATKKNTEHEQMQGRRREIKWWNSSLKNSSSTWIFSPTSPLTTYKSRLINSSFILELEF